MFNNGVNKGEENKVKTSSNDSTERTAQNSFRELLKNFASETSFGGVSKAALSEGFIRKFLWFLISATCYGFAIFMCISLVQTYLDKPIRTSIDIIYEKRVAFPSVTFCNLNQFRKMKLKNSLSNIYAIIGNYSNSKSNGSSLENSLEDQRKAAKKDFNADFPGSSMDDIPDNDLDIDDRILLQQVVSIEASNYEEKELKPVGHQFSKMILSCSWKGINCKSGVLSKYWVEIWNWRYGNCFTFNPGADLNGSSLAVFRTTKPGPSYGLSVDLNIEQNDYVSELTDEAGVVVMVHNPRQFPFPYDEGITVPPGFSSSIAVRKEMIRRVDPFQNNSCYSNTKLSKDNVFKNHLNGAGDKYSVKACMESCLATAQFRKCSCSDAKYSGYVKRVCKASDELQCANNVTTSYKNSLLDCDQKCPQPCVHEGYRYTIRTSSLTSKEKEAKMAKDFPLQKGPDFNLDDNFLRVKVFYDELNLQTIAQSTYYDLQTLLADIGGQLGLWIGISVIAVAEFGELLFSLCLVAGRKSHDKKKTKSTELELHTP